VFATLANTTFDASASPWAPEYGATATWASGHDMAGSASSGALGVVNTVVAELDGNTMVGARQCATATPGASYDLQAEVFMPIAHPGASAGLDVAFYASADCSGASDPVFASSTSTLTSAASAWTQVGESVTAPSDAHSLAVRLVVLKSFRTVAVQSFFDDPSLMLHR